jgi:hypothetical protein
LPWWDRIAYVLKQTQQPRLVLDIPEPIDIDLVSIPCVEATWIVIRSFMADENIEEVTFLAHLENRAEVSVDSEALAHGLFMTWDQVRTLSAAGMAIGSHTHDHPNLARLSEPAQSHELLESRQILSHQLGRDITGLAYPYGDPGTFTPATQRIAREAGYRLAFTACPGVNRPGRTDALAIRRLGIGITDSLPIFRARAVCQMAFGRSFF